VKPHLVHEVVRAELNARRAGTRAAKSRGLVAGGRSKPWRQKGTGRARAGSTRVPHWTGGGVAFLPRTSFDVKVNRKVWRAALRAALASHAGAGSLAIVDSDAWEAPSTKKAAALVEAWGKERPLVLVVEDDENAIAKSFRNLAKVGVVTPGELEVAAIVGARALLVSQGALEALEARAGHGSAKREAAE
jgi:large subunit ribosomal protein L4